MWMAMAEFSQTWAILAAVFVCAVAGKVWCVSYTCTFVYLGMYPLESYPTAMLNHIVVCM